MTNLAVVVTHRCQTVTAVPQAAEYGRAEMTGWYREHDLLGTDTEHVIPNASSLDDTWNASCARPGCTPATLPVLTPEP